MFYHPVVWWISGVIRTEREHCCDDLAVALSGDAHEYAVALAALEQCRWGASETALAATGGNLVKRIRRLLIPTEGPGSLLAGSALTPFVSAGILMIAAAVGLAAWQAEPSPQRFFAQAPVGQAAPEAPSKVSPYTKWLEEEVVYIIMPEERATFLALQTDAEREHFIEQFWKRRDPTPGTEENEFKDEHYRRIVYANLHFPTAFGKAGWRTDRGRIYIDVRAAGRNRRPFHWRHGASGALIDWTYRFIEGVGTNVKMEFVDPNGDHTTLT